MSNILIIGSSRGIGAGLVEYCVKEKHQVFGVSRTKTENCEWISADISLPEGVAKVTERFADEKIDTLIYCSGIWEQYGFTSSFDFRKTSYEETQKIMAVNLVAPIEITKGLCHSLSMSENPRAIYLGAISGVDNNSSEQVAYSASKYGLRGAVHCLRTALTDESIGFTTINLGNVATEEVLSDIAEGRWVNQRLIRISDIASVIDMLMSLSPSTDIGDVNMLPKID